MNRLKNFPGKTALTEVNCLRGRMRQNGRLKIHGREISVSNLEKNLFPGNGFNKEQVIDYYARVSKFLLPHLRNRPVTLKRYPDGVNGEALWEKDAPSFKPGWVKTFPIPRKTEPGVINYILINDLASLVWCASIASIELHPFLHRVPRIEQPTALVFDLDPGEGVDIVACCEAAIRVQETLTKAKLKGFPKVSGSKGIQIWVPLNTTTNYDQTKAFARAVAELLHEKYPREIVSGMSKELRGGKVFIDWSQNIITKTTVGVYSLRAKSQEPFVSMPVEWDELKRALRSGKSKRLYFDPEAALSRLKKVGDLYAPVLNLRQQLPDEFRSIGSAPRPKTPKPLEQYEAKRNFSKTSEPAPVPRRSQQGGKRRFVIQKHAASHLHYDLRLEIGDTLKSWAVPKGMPLARGERRSAFAVEDHPIDYLTFEGVIPPGEYGAGTVMVWDVGTYEVIEGNYWKGSLRVFLNGAKLKGEWQMDRQENGEKPKWMLSKVGKAVRLRDTEADKSATSGRTLDQIAQQKTAVWRNGKERHNSGRAKLGFIPPMLAVKVETIPTGKEWLYEWKYDGYRAIAVKDGDDVRVFSRRGSSLNQIFSPVVEAVGTIHADRAILDGEIIAMNEQGEMSFQYLQHRSLLPEGWHIVFCAFDLLNLERQELRESPATERRKKLATVVRRSGVLFSNELTGTPSKLLSIGRRAKREGIVAKRRDSAYQSGDRSRDWLKIQFRPQQEFVIGGFRPGGRHGLELLLVGYYGGGKLIYAGKVRGGLNRFNRKQLFDLLNPARQAKCPFANLPNSSRDHWGEGVTADEMNDYVWVKPRAVAQVKFAEWTRGDVLRHASYLGLRDDKKASEVVREGKGGVR